ncbi:hypothetical protein [Cognataquiflexum rubidum]|uniref:hypothetical protein n=1 Tax=Cognataquiflexum rubidum TaxID=2922273 RepID=UPI001F13D34D|nr:hypothetical protein [Cognataquiflexum rubidum]MCH6236403.1 hypothetical protein [Cognataquiflexum rubidum]
MTVPTGESPLSAGEIPILWTGCHEAKQVVPISLGDEVSQHTEVPTFRKGGSTGLVGMTEDKKESFGEGLWGGRRIFTLPRGLSIKKSSFGRF